MLQLNIKDLREQNGLSQAEFAQRLHIAQSTVAMWESGKNKPRLATLEKIISMFSTEANSLIDGSARSDNRNRFLIPVLGNVQAGIPIEAIEDILDYEEIDHISAAKGEYFALKIHGESMEPKFSDGDVVIVKKQDDAETGDIVIALINGDEATIKKLQKHKKGIMLVPNNPSFEPLYFSNEEIEEKPVNIIGKVVELRAKF